MCLHNPDCYIFHTRCRSCPYVSQFQHAKCACIIRTVIFFIQEVSILSLCQPVLACKMCLHNPDCYIFHTKCRSCPYASQFQHAKCACIIRTVIFSYKVSILSLCQPVLACKMCLHNPDCYIFHTRCRSCPYVSQFQHAKCACIIRTVIFFIQECRSCPYVSQFQHAKCACIIRTVIFFIQRCRSCPYVSQFQHAKCACIIRTVIFFIQGVDLVPMSASFSMLHNPDCYIFHTRCRSCPYVSQFQHAKCACIIRTVIFFIQECRSCPYVSQFQHAKCACIIRTVIFFIQRCRSCPYVSQFQHAKCACIIRTVIFFIQGVDLVPMSASFSMQNVLA